VSESTAHMADLARRLQDLEAQLKESHETLRLLRDVEENNRHYRDQNTSLRGEVAGLARYREYRHQNTSLRGEVAG